MIPYMIYEGFDFIWFPDIILIRDGNIISSGFVDQIIEILVYPQVLFILKEAYSRVFWGITSNDVAGLIAAAIVLDDYFQVWIALAYDAINLLA